MITGVREAVSAVDIELLKKTARSRPRKADLYHELLAGVNLRASKRSTLVSLACMTAHMAPKGEPVTMRSHHLPEHLAIQESKNMPFVLFGIDCNEGVGNMMDALRRASDEADRRTAEAGKRTRNPLR